MVRIDFDKYNVINEILNKSQRVNLFNASCNDSVNESCMDLTSTTEFESEKVFWALLLIPLPFVAVIGNILVILSIYKEKSLQTATNYYIVSLAFADLLVAAVVMPFAVYVLVNVHWELSDTLCDFYIAVDVTCSTASIFNLVAISIDRYIAVTKPIKYSKHKNNKRVFLTIAFVWLVSAAIGSPIVLGLNTSPERIPQLCVFYNSDFIIYSSLSSFYIPCLVMIFLYYQIFKCHWFIGPPVVLCLNTCPEKIPQLCVFYNSELVIYFSVGSFYIPCLLMIFLYYQIIKVIRERAKKNKKRAAALGNRPSLGTPPLENSLPRKAHITQDPIEQTLQVVVEKDIGGATTAKTDSIGDDEMDEDDTDENKPVINGEESYQHKVIFKLTTLSNSSKTEETSSQETQFSQTARDSPNDSPRNDSLRNSLIREVPKKNGILVKTDKNNKTTGVVVQRKKKSRFNLGKKHKSSSKKREKASAKRERKATKTLAIVLGMFLMCWVPFFTCNILDAICIKLETDTWRPGMTVFLLTTWLGYINSCVNPVIYTIFNLEFRKAFKKLLQSMCSCSTASSK